MFSCLGAYKIVAIIFLLTSISFQANILLCHLYYSFSWYLYYFFLVSEDFASIWYSPASDHAYVIYFYILIMVQRTWLFVEIHSIIFIQVQRTVILFPFACIFKKIKQIFFFIVNFIFNKHFYIFFPEWFLLMMHFLI